MTNKQETRLSKKEYCDMLRQNICEVCFEKLDGSFRVMKCTLVVSLIPRKMREIDQIIMLRPKRHSNLNTVNVYDLEKNVWRSFRVDSVATFKVISTS